MGEEETRSRAGRRGKTRVHGLEESAACVRVFVGRLRRARRRHGTDRRRGSCGEGRRAGLGGTAGSAAMAGASGADAGRAGNAGIRGSAETRGQRLPPSIPRVVTSRSPAASATVSSAATASTRDRHVRRVHDRGCGGTENNFKTQDACVESCGSCPLWLPRDGAECTPHTSLCEYSPHNDCLCGGRTGFGCFEVGGEDCRTARREIPPPHDPAPIIIPQPWTCECTSGTWPCHWPR